MTQCFPSRLGGIESLVSNLALGLSKKDKVMVLADKYHYFHDSIYDNLYKDRNNLYGTTTYDNLEHGTRIKYYVLQNGKRIDMI